MVIRVRAKGKGETFKVNSALSLTSNAKQPSKPAPSVNFLVKPEEKRKYDMLFNQLQPVDDKLPGDKVRHSISIF